VLQPLEPEVAAILDQEFEAARRAQAGNRGRAEHLHYRVRHLFREPLLDLGDDRVAAQVRRQPFVERLQRDEHLPEVGAVRPQ
jgi:hypothetical protein